MDKEFVNKIKSYVDRGIEKSKTAVGKMCAGVEDFGQQSTVRLEITSLQSKKKRLLSQLGTVVYESFAEKKLETVSADSAEVAELVKQLQTVCDDIAVREQQLAAMTKKGKPDTASPDVVDAPAADEPGAETAADDMSADAPAAEPGESD